MKKFLLFVLFLCPIVSMAQEQTKIDSTMTFRISEIEVYPELLLSGKTQNSINYLPGAK